MASFQCCFFWMQLARISALPTAVSNVMLGYLLAVRLHAGTFHLGELFLLILASACLYSAGMILNDVFDVEEDRNRRPERPLPSGKIKAALARQVGLGLLILGVASSAIAAWWIGANHLSDFLRPVAVSITLAFSILTYDVWLKSSIVAPWLMGLCRALNVLLGASTISRGGNFLDIGNFASPILWWAFALAIYVAGITLLARKESVENPQRIPLWIGVGLISLGVAGFATIGIRLNAVIDGNELQFRMFPWVIAIIAYPVVRRAIAAAATGAPPMIQAFVITGLRTIIIFDAALCFLAAPDQPVFAIAVLSLLIPSLFLSRWLNPT